MAAENKRKLPKFNVKEDDWESYRRLVELMLEEKEITEDRKKQARMQGGPNGPWPPARTSGSYYLT